MGAERPSDERPDAGVLDTTGSNPSTGSDTEGRDDTVPRPHHHEHVAALININDFRSYVYHLAWFHNDDRTARTEHYNDNNPNATFVDHDATAVYQHDDPKPVRDARAYIERAATDGRTYIVDAWDTP